MNFQKLIIAFIYFLSISNTKEMEAQQDPMYSMYMYDKMLINPAYAGSSNWAVGTLKYRQQYTSLNGHPITQTFNFHSPIQKKHLGIGFKIINDKVAIVSNLNAAVLLSYHLNFAGGKLSMGIETGLLSKTIDYQKLILSSRNDQTIPISKLSSTAFDLSAGMYYKKKQFYVGISSYHLNSGNFKNNITPNSQSHLYNHLYLIVGKVFEIKKNWTVEPNMLFKYQAFSPQLDLNTTVYYKDKAGLGFQFRTNDAICLMMRMNINENLRIAYAYDITTSKFANHASGTHEIVISYAIKLPPPPVKKEIHPRYYY